jgi:hypothetical protein
MMQWRITEPPPAPAALALASRRSFSCYAPARRHAGRGRPGLLVTISGDDPWRIVGFSIWRGLILSTCEHGVPLSHSCRSHSEKLFRVDHVAIFYCRRHVPRKPHRHCHGGWGGRCSGSSGPLPSRTIVNSASVRCRWVSASIYVAMGWAAVVAVVPLACVPPSALAGCSPAGFLPAGASSTASAQSYPRFRLSRDLSRLRARRQRAPRVHAALGCALVGRGAVEDWADHLARSG